MHKAFVPVEMIAEQVAVICSKGDNRIFPDSQIIEHFENTPHRVINQCHLTVVLGPSGSHVLILLATGQRSFANRFWFVIQFTFSTDGRGHIGLIVHLPIR